jgi:hypothetical protein
MRALPDRWVTGILLSFLLVFLANGALIYAALRVPDPVVPSYGGAGR